MGYLRTRYIPKTENHYLLQLNTIKLGSLTSCLKQICEVHFWIEYIRQLSLKSLGGQVIFVLNSPLLGCTLASAQVEKGRDTKSLNPSSSWLFSSHPIFCIVLACNIQNIPHNGSHSQRAILAYQAPSHDH